MRGQDYYENGPYSGQSTYLNYSWLPNHTFPIAAGLVERLGLACGDRIVDFGCAKGYLVKALRELGYDAYGFDVSDYAIQHADAAVREYVHQQWFPAAGWCIAKDTVQQLEDLSILGLLPWFFQRICVIVPLGYCGQFLSEPARRDAHNRTAETLAWWVQKMDENGWNVQSCTDDLTDIIPFSTIGTSGMIVAESGVKCESL